MAFHFPVMPRIFMAIHLEDRFPLVDILAQTPELPAGCQWALFLRNHDELTLEMVTDEERDAMVRAYAAEPAMRVNLGIRRRLAPLTGNQRRHIELMNALLFSLPGTPVLYYGDEIGMGDNVYLGDRNGVRTPMQWSADKNAGFSRANPQKLVLPVIIDPDYHYESVNVEAQQRSAGSLLWWTKRLVAQRKRHAAFGRGTLELLRPDNPRIFAFVRRCDDEILLVVANLSRFVELAELDLSPWKGTVPVELFGRRALPPVGDAPYPLTLAGHGFYWFSLSPRARDEARAAAYEPPVLETAAFPPPAGSDGDAFAEALAGWAAAQAWFAGRRRRVEAARIVEAVALAEGAHLVVLELSYDEGGSERYLAAPTLAEGARAQEIRARSPNAVIASLGLALEGGTAVGTPLPISSGAMIFDALADAQCARTLLEGLFVGARVRGRAGVVTASATAAMPVGSAARETGDGAGQARAPGTMILFGARFFVEVRRRLDDGASPGLALDRFLLQCGLTAPVPPLAGAVELATPPAEPVALAVVRAFAPFESDGFAHTVEEVHRFFERVLARGGEEPGPPVPSWDVARLPETEPAALVRDAVGSFLDTARLFGRRTAELHRALAGVASSADVLERDAAPPSTPEAWSTLDQRGAYQSMRNLAGRCLRELGRLSRFLPPEVAPLATRVLGREDEALRRFRAILGRRLTAPRTRHLGALDLRKVLIAGNDAFFADLDGDRTRPVAERRRRGSPLRDVAGLLRSLHEAVFSTLLDPARVRPEDVEAARPWGGAFWEASAASLVQGYLEIAGPSGLLPRDRVGDGGELGVLLDTFLLESAFGALAVALRASEPHAETLSLILLAALLEGSGPVPST
jgi:maltose alpha-D-glucosyltransferase/alpha-amylase